MAADWNRSSHHRSSTEWQKARLRSKTSRKQASKILRSASTPARSRKEARLEAVLFVAEGACSARKLAQYATLADHKEARELINRLNEAYERSQSSFRIECVAGGYRLLTRPEFAPWLDKLHDRKSEVQLSAPALETLTIVAYRQPVTRADVEAVRGVQSTEILKLLMEKGLVRITGEDDSLGRPYLYGTTNQFLESFGLGSLKDLPLREEFEISVEPESEELAEEAVVEENASESEAVESEEEPPQADQVA
ncbi:MAG: SMC-Scp complex subunit ScpB [Planctomycetaceae bacterium]|nr:SMC-Scp complex subunit ScpB [Planctomycetaceae bacterium]